MLRTRVLVVPLLTMLTASASFAAPRLEPGRLNEFRVELTSEMRRIAGRGELSPVTHALVTVAVPAAFDASRDSPAMVICATTDPGYNSSRRLLGQYAGTALERGWLLIAADAEDGNGPDGLFVRYALAATALAVLELRWPRAAQSRIAFGGFSGGAKCAGWLAAAFASRGRGIAGVYLAGINEDTIVSAARELDVLDARFKRTPVFVQSGYDDTIATTVQHIDVADKLRRAGFANVRVEHFAGGHVVEPMLFGTALDWFREIGAESKAR